MGLSRFGRKSPPKGENEISVMKMVLVGPTGSGKTSLLQTFTTGNFLPNIDRTIGASVVSKLIDSASQKVKLELWDTAGSSSANQFEQLSPIFFRGASIGVIIFDVNDQGAEESVSGLIEYLEMNAPDDMLLSIVGTKVDLIDDVGNRCVQKLRNLSIEKEILFLEATATDEDSAYNLFMALVNYSLEGARKNMFEDEMLLTGGFKTPSAAGAASDIGQSQNQKTPASSDTSTHHPLSHQSQKDTAWGGEGTAADRRMPKQEKDLNEPVETGCCILS